MRNLKRALSLALATVMTLGLMVVGTGAVGYDDVTSEDNQEAIEVLQQVGIMTGDENGNFNPDSSVTRNEMAVIMSQLLNLDYDYYRGINAFTDVPSWAAPYVAACVAEGVTAGIGNGQYGGSNNVTAAQAALMLMKALGYFQYQGDFNPDWQVATIRQASYINLFDNVDANAEQALTRSQVAQMVLNALKSNMVTFTGTVGATVGDVVINYNPEYTARTNAASKYNSIDVGTTNIASDDRYYVQLGEELYDCDLKLKGDVDVFGRPARYWEYDGQEIGTYVNYDLMVGEYTTEVTGKDLYDLLGASTIKDYDLTVVIDGVADEDIDDAIFTAADMNKNNKKGVGETGNGVLTQVFVNTNTKDIIITEINTYLAIADKDYDEKKDELDITVFGLDKTGDEYVKVPSSCSNNKDDSEGFTIAGEDFDVADMLEDDALLVTVADGEIQTVAVPEIVSDVEITAFKLTSSVTVDGAKYSYSDAAEYDFEVLDHYTGASGSNLKNITYNVYLDSYGYAIGVDEVSTPDNYVFITGIDDAYSNLSNKTLDASAIFLDGTMEVIEVKSDKGTLPTSDAVSAVADALINKWCTYTVDKNGVYTLTEVADEINTGKNVKVAQYADEDHDTVIDLKHTSLPGAKSGSYHKVYGNDATVYLTASIKEIKVDGLHTAIIIDAVDSVTTGIKNANIQPWDKADAKAEADNGIAGTGSSDNASGVYTLYKSNGYIIASVVVGEDAAATKNLVYVHSSNVEQEGYDKAADEWTWTRKVISNGQEIELTEVGDALTWIGNASNGEGKMTQHEWYQVKYNADGEVISVEDVSTALKGYERVTNIKNVEKAVNEKDTVLYEEPFTADQPSMIGSTLFVSTKDKTGFFVAEDVNITLIQTVKNKEETTFETGVDELEDIVNDLNKENGLFDYTINAILEDGAATSVVIYDKANSYNDTPVTPDVKPGEFAPASWNPTGGANKTGAIELRYYKTPMSDSQIKSAISDMMGGQPVERLNKYMGYVVMENGDMYPVDFTQIRVIAVTVNDEIRAYMDYDVKPATPLVIDNLPANTDYIRSAAAPSAVKTSDKNGEFTIVNAPKADLEYVTAYTITGVDGTKITGKLSDGKTEAGATNKYVAEGETLVVTFTAAATDGYNIYVDGVLAAEVEAKAAVRTAEVEVTGDVTIVEKVSKTDLATLLSDKTTKVINLEAGETYTLSSGVYITTDKVINGNGATIETKGGLTGGKWALIINADGIDLTINDVNFETAEDGIAVKQSAKNYTVTLNGCSFDGYSTSVQLFDIKGGEITDCEFNSKAVDISITGATGKVTVEGNTYTTGLKEHIGLGGSADEMDNVEINDSGIIVNRYPS